MFTLCKSSPFHVADSRHSQNHRSTCSNVALLLAVFMLLTLSAHAATYIVTDTSDSATDLGSLRYAVNTVNAGSGGDTINIIALGTITLTSGTLTLSEDVTINGTGAEMLTISGTQTGTALWIKSGTTASISGLTIANGGGSGHLSAGGIWNEGTLSINQCAISNNTLPSGGYGAGILNSNGTLTINNSTFSGNTISGGSGNAGGAIADEGGPNQVTINNSTFSGNSASTGGAIWSQVPFSIENSTIYGNTARTSGGGIYVLANGGHVTATITNSIVAGNTTTASPGDDCDSCGTQSTNNLISTTAAPISAATVMLGPLQYNGGLTQTIMPLPGSPAIGAGLSSTSATDQRGFGRNQGSGTHSDLGSVSTNYLTVTTVADSTSGNNCSGGVICSLRDAINWINSDDVSGDIIFANGLAGTITLASAMPPINNNMNLAGPGANSLNISGSYMGTIFCLNNVTVTNISGITISKAQQSSTCPGSGIYNTGILTITNSIFSGSQGFNIGVMIYDTDGTVVISNSTTSGNEGGPGGGIYTSGTSSKLAVYNSTISGNSSGNGGNGGGIFINQSSAIISGSTISGNVSNYDGGGIFNQDGLLMVINSTISGNTSNVGSGAGIYNYGLAFATIVNSTISGNNAVIFPVGGIYNTGHVTLTNSIVAGNTMVGDDCAGCGTQSANNLIGTLNNTITATQLMLGPLAYNGSNQTVQTMLPLPGSPAIEAGLDSTLSTDERGMPRPTGVGVVSDLGAVQTNYTAVQFVQQPSNTLVNTTMSPAVTLSVIENGFAMPNIAVPINIAGVGTLSGTLTETTTTPQGGGAAIATYADLSVNATGTGDMLNVSLPITPAGATTPLILTASSNSFDISAPSPPPTPSVAISFSAATVTVSAPGQSATDTITLTPSGGYAGTITLACSGLPSEAACAFNPASVTFTAGSSAAQTVTLTVSTTAAVAALRPYAPLNHHSNPMPMLAGAFWLPGLLAAGAGLRKRRTSANTSRVLHLLVLLVLLAGVGMMTACGGSSSTHSIPAINPGTPTGSSKVTVTITGTGSLSTSATFDLAVQ